jgi:hypothetical protein
MLAVLVASILIVICMLCSAAAQQLKFKEPFETAAVKILFLAAYLMGCLALACARYL